MRVTKEGEYQRSGDIMIEKANPVKMRKALEMANMLKGAGILFVPMPVLSDEDHSKLVRWLQDRLDQIEKMADEFPKPARKDGQ